MMYNLPKQDVSIREACAIVFCFLPEIYMYTKTILTPSERSQLVFIFPIFFGNTFDVRHIATSVAQPTASL